MLSGKKGRIVVKCLQVWFAEKAAMRPNKVNGENHMAETHQAGKTDKEN